MTPSNPIRTGKPSWLRRKLPSGPQYEQIRAMIGKGQLHTVCQEANCPNQFECFSARTATFLIMGAICTRGCRFCQAGMIYRPVRERSPDSLTNICDQSISSTGYEDISLLSLSTGDYGCIVPLMEQLMLRYASQNIAVSLPSLRAGTLTPELMKLIKTVRKTGFTIAPEAGSQRLRDVINKGIDKETILASAEALVAAGIPNLKLYFMVGLPTETDEDIAALIDLVDRSARRFPRGVAVNISPFVPKAHTPFQWQAAPDPKVVKGRLAAIEKGDRLLAIMTGEWIRALRAFSGEPLRR